MSDLPKHGAVRWLDPVTLEEVERYPVKPDLVVYHFLKCGMGCDVELNRLAGKLSRNGWKSINQERRDFAYKRIKETWVKKY